MTPAMKTMRAAILSAVFGAIIVTGVLPLVALLAFVPTVTVSAQDAPKAAPSPRAADHGEFGRLVFDWDQPVKWSADVLDGKVVIRFDRPFTGDTAVLRNTLRRYIRQIEVDPDRRMVSLTPTQPVTATSLDVGKSTVVDLRFADKPATNAASPAAPTTATAPATSNVETVNVRGAAHTGFHRLVFEWAKTVPYTVNVDNNQIKLAFLRPASIDRNRLTQALPSDVKLVDLRPEGVGTAVVLALPSGVRPRHFTTGPKVVLDLARDVGTTPPETSPPPATAESAKTPPPATAPQTPPSAPPLAPPPGSDDQPPAARPLGAAAITAPVTTPDTAPSPPQPPPAPSVSTEPLPLPRDPSQPLATIKLSFPAPSGLAVFSYAGWWWAVSDGRIAVNGKQLQAASNGIILNAEQIASRQGGGTALRFLTRPGISPQIRQDGNSWILELVSTPVRPRLSIPIERQFDKDGLPGRGRLIIPVGETARPEVVIQDPETGVRLDVVPFTAAGQGLIFGGGTPGLTLLPSLQGLAFVPQSDGMRADVSRNGLVLTMPGGLYLSPAAQGESEDDRRAMADASGDGLNLQSWRRGGAEKFSEDQQYLLQRLTRARPEDRGRWHLEVARHMLANGLGPEAVGELRTVAKVDPALAKSPQFAAVSGVGHILMRRNKDAIAELSRPELKDDPQAKLWLAVAQYRQDPSQAAALSETLATAADLLTGLPPRLQMELARTAVPGLIDAKNVGAAAQILGALSKSRDLGEFSKYDLAGLSYLQGRVAEASNQWDTAIERYLEAENSDSRLDRAESALRRIELQLKTNQIDPDVAAHQMARLRFAWRDGDFEFDILKRTAQLQLDKGLLIEVLRLLERTIPAHAEHPRVKELQDIMDKAFAKIFLGGEAEKMSPIAAISLFDEFQELTPPGAKGDEIIRRLADRLVDIDLLDRAEDLLGYQIKHRITGLERARVAARLAFVQLSDQKPNDALRTLDSTEIPGIEEPLASQRRLLKAQALADLGRMSEALDLLINDDSETANRLRVEIYWKMQNWAQVVQSLEPLIPLSDSVETLNATEARALMDLATAMTLARDERGLQRIRRTWLRRMNATPFADAFALLSAPPERGIPDYRRLDEKIKQVEKFQNFLQGWQEKVKEDGLSSAIP